MWLPADTFAEVVRATPLVAIDLVVRDHGGAVLLGRRTNEPARGSWFVPGGRIRKGETLDAAHRRITRAELGVPLERAAARFLGVFEHLYDTNALGRPGFGTHYVVLAHLLTLPREAVAPPDDQHSGYRWLPPAALAADPGVHPNTRAYAPLLAAEGAR